MKKITIIIFTLAFFSSSIYGQWEKLYFPGGTPYTLLETPQGLLAANFNNIYKSTDNGITWDSLSSISSLGISKILQVGDVLLANTSRNLIWPRIIPSVFRSDDFGKTWYIVLDAVYGGESIAFCNSGTYADLDGKLFCSNDTGRTWNLLNTSSFFPDQIGEVISDGNTLYARINSEALYRSDDNALTWDSLDTKFSDNFFNILARDSRIYLGTYSDGFYISIDRGDNWQNASVGLPDSAGIRALHLVDNNIIASISKDFQQSIYRYNLKENKWHFFNEGFSIQLMDWIFDFANNSEFIFLASDNSIWRRPVSDLITDVPRYNNQLIKDIILFQNYPNPFNPSTIIKYNLQKSDNVTLKIYNLSGQEIETLVNEFQTIGEHTITWSPTGLPSGLYIYKLQLDDYCETKKLVFLK